MIDRVRTINFCALQKNARVFGEKAGVEGDLAINNFLSSASRELFGELKKFFGGQTRRDRKSGVQRREVGRSVYPGYGSRLGPNTPLLTQTYRTLSKLAQILFGPMQMGSNREFGTSVMKYQSAVENGATKTLVAGEEERQHAVLPVGKRIMDLFIAVPLLAFLSPLMLLIGILIKLQDGGSMFFIQSRRGFRGEYFYCMKFRTMRTNAQEILELILEADGALAAEWAESQKLRNDPRITFFGQFLRRTSLDELPQLLNIIRGEMSVVGPRPIVAEEVARYQDDIAYYDSVRPGVTGLWQVEGRSDTSYDERVQFDTEYAENVSLLADLTILLRTIPAVLLGRGAR